MPGSFPPVTTDAAAHQGLVGTTGTVSVYMWGSCSQISAFLSSVDRGLSRTVSSSTHVLSLPVLLTIACAWLSLGDDAADLPFADHVVRADRLCALLDIICMWPEIVQLLADRPSVERLIARVAQHVRTRIAEGRVEAAELTLYRADFISVAVLVAERALEAQSLAARSESEATVLPAPDVGLMSSTRGTLVRVALGALRESDGTRGLARWARLEMLLSARINSTQASRNFTCDLARGRP